MAFTEVVTLSNFVQGILIGSGPDQYILPSAEPAIANRKASEITFTFTNLILKLPARQAATHTGKGNRMVSPLNFGLIEEAITGW